MRQADRLAALGTLAAGMAHEIRNPLSAIKTFVQLLPRKLEKAGFLDKFNRTVPRELDRINRLIEDLLELARTPRYRLEDLALRSLLEQNLDLLDEEIRMADVVLERDIEESLPLVWADPDHLAKAFHNLVRNALQAMPSGGRLRVEAQAVEAPRGEGGRRQDERDWCAVKFLDTGSGIPQEVLPNIFNPFFSTKDSGTGLGLAITHKVIAEHGGMIDVSSQPGRGSCFTVFLPGRRH
jgi:signal transduction histidine kinase